MPRLSEYVVFDFYIQIANLKKKTNEMKEIKQNLGKPA